MTWHETKKATNKPNTAKQTKHNMWDSWSSMREQRQMWGLRRIDILAEVQSTCRRSSVNVFVCVISLSLDSNCPKNCFEWLFQQELGLVRNCMKDIVFSWLDYFLSKANERKVEAMGSSENDNTATLCLFLWPLLLSSGGRLTSGEIANSFYRYPAPRVAISRFTSNIMGPMSQGGNCLFCVEWDSKYMKSIFVTFNSKDIQFYVA